MPKLRTITLPPYEANYIDVEVNSVVVRVQEIEMRQLTQFLQVCLPIMHLFNDGELLGARRKDGAQTMPEDYALWQALAQHGDAFVAAAAACSNAPKEFLERLPPHLLFEVAAAVLEVNASFFVHALAPSLRKMLDTLVLLAAGATLFNSSSGLGTATKTSSDTGTASSSSTLTPYAAATTASGNGSSASTGQPT